MDTNFPFIQCVPAIWHYSHKRAAMPENGTMEADGGIPVSEIVGWQLDLKSDGYYECWTRTGKPTATVHVHAKDMEPLFRRKPMTL